MEKSFLFLSLLFFTSAAYADPEDAIFTVINKTSQNLSIKAVGKGKVEQKRPTPSWEVQSEIDGGQKRYSNRKN